MDCSAARDRVGNRHEAVGTPQGQVDAKCSLAPDDALQCSKAPAGIVAVVETSSPHAVGGRTFTAMPATTAGATQAESDQLEDQVGVTTESAESLKSCAGQLGLAKFTEKLTKMVTGAEGDP